ncbi:relaxase MobL [Gemmiger formicilis]
MKVKAILNSGYFANARHATNYIAYIDRQSPIFDQNGTEKNVLSAQVEVEAPSNSTVWRHVYSLNASDCERLGVDRNYMKNLIALKADELAKAYNISPSNLRMVCSWHNKDFHPHLHFLVWSTDSREAFIPHREKETDKSAALNAATRKVKSSFTNEIFRGDLAYLKEEKSKRRDKLNEQLRKLVSSEYLVDREITDALKDLGKDLRETPGKHTYKFLPPQLKAEVDSVLEKIMQRDPILRSMYEEYLDSQKELALTYASYEETLDKKFAEIENSFFHPYCDFEERRAGRAEVTRHNIIIHAAERYVRPTVQRKTASHVPQKKSTPAMTSAGNAAALSQTGKPPNAPAVQEKTASHSEPENATPDEKVDGSDYQEKSPTYAVQNMLFRLAKTLNRDQQQAQGMNRAAHVANGLTGEKQNVRKLKTGLSDERNLSTIEL